MGRVWAARRLNSPTAQFVAVKTALEELSGDPEFERVFVDEARIASSIVHPNVCTIYELGAERSIPYLVMEWINGGSLHDILAASAERRIDPMLAARIVASACAGLHAAHELTDLDGAPMHVVHRDVSPQNILVSEYGHVKVADFGVARAKGQLHKPTATGELKGKLSYMAPEQLTTKLFDRRADIFALGCVLFQSTTGQRPFHGNDALETMYRLLETDCERPSVLVPDYPPELERIVLKALAKNLDLRYQTAEQLEHDLDRFLSGNGRLITDRDIADLVSRTLGSVVARRTEDLRQAVEVSSHPRKTIPAGPKRVARPATSLAQTEAAQSNLDAGVSSTDPFNDFAATPKAAWESGKPRAKQTERKFSLAGPLAYGLAGTVVVAVALFVFSQSRSLTAAGAPTSAMSASNQPPGEVEMRIRAEPREATLTLDDGTTAQGLLVITRDRGSKAQTVTASLIGYTSTRREISFDRSRELEIDLAPEPAESKPATLPPTNPANRTTTQQRPTAQATATAKDPGKPGDSVQTKNRKPKRPLDPTNPFSEQ